jgi:tRNA A-37 threonylcarbamoyl transferase component Bud32
MWAVPERFRVVLGAGGRSWILRQGTPLEVEPAQWDSWLDGLDGTVLTREGGRSPSRVLVIPGIGQTVMRRYFHGGALAKLTRDIFLGRTRPLQELAASERLREFGVATPEILAVYFRKSGPCFYRACLLSRLIPDGENLREWLRRNRRNPPAWGRVIRKTGAAVAALHGAGCIHRDLNLSNLLLAREEIWILDLDGAALIKNPGVRERTGNIQRLYRSFRKEANAREPLSSRQRLMFLRSYAGRDRLLFRALALSTGFRRERSALRRLSVPGGINESS